MKKKAMFQETMDAWIVMNSKLYNDCKEYIINALKDEPEQQIIFDRTYNDEYVTVSYDGGNHPEYDSDCFADVYAVKLIDGEVYLDLEYNSKYSIDRINAEHLYDVADMVRTHLSNDHTEQIADMKEMEGVEEEEYEEED